MPRPGGGGGGGGSTSVRGTNGNDSLTVAGNQALRTTTYDGRGGVDTLDLSALTSGVSISLQNSPLRNSIVYAEREFTGNYYTFSLSEPDPSRVSGTIKNIENLVGTSHDDFLFVDSGTAAKYIDAGGGNDAIGTNGAGHGTIVGGTGSDTMLVYWSNNTLVGGTYADGVATPDGESDTFMFGGSGTILDFELGIDRLQIEAEVSAIPAILAAQWQDVTVDGGPAARLVADGQTITLVGLTAAQAATIPIQFTAFDTGTSHVLTGGPGDDTFFAFTAHGEDVVLPSGSGHDTIVYFDTATDVLVFPDGGPASWTEVEVNGETALLGIYDGGASSVTLLGLTGTDIPLLPG